MGMDMGIAFIILLAIVLTFVIMIAVEKRKAKKNRLNDKDHENGEER